MYQKSSTRSHLIPLLMLLYHCHTLLQQPQPSQRSIFQKCVTSGSRRNQPAL